MLILDDYIPLDPFEEKPVLSWPVFLQLLESYVYSHRWLIEYDKPTDHSCAIFAQEDIADEQLPLFPNLELYARPFKSINFDQESDCRIRKGGGDYRVDLEKDLKEW